MDDGCIKRDMFWNNIKVDRVHRYVRVDEVYVYRVILKLHIVNKQRVLLYVKHQMKI